MDWIRRLVYRLGFRPKPGSVLYSPSRAFIESVGDPGAALVEAMESVRASITWSAQPSNSDDEVLGRLLRRFINDPDRHPAHDPFVWVDNGSIVLDGRIDLTPEEAAVVEKVERS